MAMKIGLALGGGGARGLAHIGVLTALEEHGLVPDIVAGASIGAVVGALYSLSGSARDLEPRARRLVQSPEFKALGLKTFFGKDEPFVQRVRAEILEKLYVGSLLFRRAHLKPEATDRLFQTIFGDKDFKDGRIRFVCNALDIKSGKDVVFDQGPLWRAVRASCAIPGIFPPYLEGGMVLVDGGAVDNIPVEPLRRHGADLVIAVHLGGRPNPDDLPVTGAQISQRVLQIMKRHLDERILEGADYCLRPEVSTIHWADFSSIDLLIDRGREAVAGNWPALAALRSPLGRLGRAWRRGVKNLLGG